MRLQTVLPRSPVEAIADASQVPAVYFDVYLVGWTKEGLAALVAAVLGVPSWGSTRDKRVAQLDAILAEHFLMDRSRATAKAIQRQRAVRSDPYGADLVDVIVEYTGVSSSDVLALILVWHPVDKERLRAWVLQGEWRDRPADHLHRLRRMGEKMGYRV